MRAPSLLWLSVFAMSILGCTNEAATADPPAKAPTIAPAVTTSDEGAAAALDGTTPPEWTPDPALWTNSKPLTLAELRGKVVLVRWWTAGCPYCSASAPALRDFDRRYGPRGLVVVGMYHHKDAAPFDPKVYEETGKKYGFTFPLAFDPGMRTLKAWSRGVDTGFTSMTFVLDKHGVIRHVHPGGQYVEGDAALEKMRNVIEQLLAED